MAKPEQKLLEVFKDLIKHNGYGQLKVEVKILKRGQQEVIIYYGKQYRFVIDTNEKIISDEGSH
jgi:hypothetical protein